MRRDVPNWIGSWQMLAGCMALLAMAACSTPYDNHFDAEEPGKGPGQMVAQKGEPVSATVFRGVTDGSLPAPRDVTPPVGDDSPNCGEDCQSYCDGLELKNPVNRGLCPSLWGVGLKSRPIVTHEACRRIFADTLGRFPSLDEVEQFCRDRDWSEVAAELVGSEEFVDRNKRHWADRLLYDPEAVSIVRIYDMDELVGKVYRGEVPYDQFAAVVSAHPVVTRRYDTAADRAEAVWWLFLGRPPLGTERSDMAKLYNLWENGYYDHPQLNTRLPDAHIRYRCVDEDSGLIDPQTRGDCTSILFGYHELILLPDIRARPGNRGQETMWSGLLKAEEWHKLQMPGRIISQQPLFWEKAIDDVLRQYLDYDLGRLVPEVRHELMEHLINNNGDIRSVHHAVLSSAAYLQSSTGRTDTEHRWTYGPLKQAEPEIWIDTMAYNLQYAMGSCDHRIPKPERLLDSETIAATALVQNSRWTFDEEGEVERNYVQLARSLGGCPANSDGARFKIVSILTTSTQLNFVNQVCNPGLEGGIRDARVKLLLPPGVAPDTAVDAKLAEDILANQVNLFLGRKPTGEELAEVREYGEACQRSKCSAEEFARPACFALLSSAEMLFY